METIDLTLDVDNIIRNNVWRCEANTLNITLFYCSSFYCSLSIRKQLLFMTFYLIQQGKIALISADMLMTKFKTNNNTFYRTWKVFASTIVNTNSFSYLSISHFSFDINLSLYESIVSLSASLLHPAINLERRTA